MAEFMSSKYVYFTDAYQQYHSNIPNFVEYASPLRGLVSDIFRLKFVDSRSIHTSFRDVNQEIQATPDEIHGFPSNDNMSNLIEWEDHAYCFVSGRLWSLCLRSFKWKMETVQEHNPEETTKNHRLWVESDFSGIIVLNRYAFVINRWRITNEKKYMLMRKAPVPAADDVLRRPPRIRDPDTRMVEAVLQVRIARSTAKENPDDFDDGERTDVVSRQCFICLTDNPNVRCAFIPCGHIACRPCTKALRDKFGRIDAQCPYCRQRIESSLQLFE